MKAAYTERAARLVRLKSELVGFDRYLRMPGAEAKAKKNGFDSYGMGLVVGYIDEHGDDIATNVEWQWWLDVPLALKVLPLIKKLVDAELKKLGVEL